MTGSLVEYSRKSESENFMLGNIFGDSRFYVSILSVIRHKVNLSFIVYRRLFLSLLRKILFTMPLYLLRQTDISISYPYLLNTLSCSQAFKSVALSRILRNKNVLRSNLKLFHRLNSIRRKYHCSIRVFNIHLDEEIIN